MSIQNILIFILLILIIIFLAIACFVVWATKPNKFRMFDIPAIYAHRGLHDNDKIPENSLSAFKNANEKNIGVELDVHLTKDGVPVVIHDSDLKRLCNTDSFVEDMTYDELKDLKILGTDETIPSFKDVLVTCGEIPVLCEIKTRDTEQHPELCSAVYEMIKEYTGQIVIESFNPYVLGWFRENAPEIIRGQLSNGKDEFTKNGLTGFEFTFAANLMLNFISRPDFIAYNFKNDSLGIALNRIYGTRLVAWTVKSMDDVQVAAADGYSSFIGEDFDLSEV